MITLPTVTQIGLVSAMDHTPAACVCHVSFHQPRISFSTRGELLQVISRDVENTHYAVQSIFYT